MHFHLPKPLHGWREFAGEVGIIVVGVLIALSAEQVVETIHLRQQTHEARQQLRQELQTSYVLSDERREASACLGRQIDALEQTVLQSGSVLDPVPLQKDKYFMFVYRAPSRPWPVQVFDNVRGEPVYGQLSQVERNLLGETYTQLRDMQLMNDAEDNAAGVLMVMTKPLPLDAGVKAHLLEILEGERRRVDLMAVLASQIMDSAATFGARPETQRVAQLRAESGTLLWCKSHGFAA